MVLDQVRDHRLEVGSGAEEVDEHAVVLTKLVHRQGRTEGQTMGDQVRIASLRIVEVLLELLQLVPDGVVGLSQLRAPGSDSIVLCSGHGHGPFRCVASMPDAVCHRHATLNHIQAHG